MDIGKSFPGHKLFRQKSWFNHQGYKTLEEPSVKRKIVRNRIVK